MVAKCITKAELKKYGLEDATPDQVLKAMREVSETLTNNRRQTIMQATILQKNIDYIMAYKDKNGNPDPAQGLKALLVTDRTELSNRSGIESRMHAVNAQAHSQISEMMEEFMPTMFGLKRDRVGQRRIVRALFGEQTGDPKYQRFAKDWMDLVESLRIRFNKAGGEIGKIDDWNLPQHHDAYLVKDRGFDEWFRDIVKAVDLDKMDIPDDEVPQVFRKAYDNIITGGLESFEPGSSFGRSKLANRHREARFFKFKNADAWLEYQEKYTDATPYMAMMDHVTMISNEIGLMENLGPNADITFRTLADHAAKAAGDANAVRAAEKIYTNLSGKTNPISQKFADRMQALRNVTTGLKLPAAALSALPDVIFNSMTANYNGLPAMRVITRFLKTLSANSAEDRAFAAKLWTPLEMLIDEAHSASRFADVAGQKTSAKFSSFVMRGSGLNAWTHAGKMAFHAEFMSGLADPKIRANANMKKSFERYGITPEDLTAIENSKKLVKNGIEYVDPENLPRDTAERLVSMVISETKYAVPEGDALVRAVMNQGTRKGEVGGEILRSVTMFKTFPATIIANHWARAIHGHESSLSYITKMAIGTWVLGTVVTQLKEIAAGREPIDWDNPELWKEGAMRGGSLSLVGDIMSSDSRSWGQSFQDFALGPIGGEIDKVLWRGVLGTYDDLLKGEIEAGQIVNKAIGHIPDYVPGQFWYTKTIMERAFLDSMKELKDPNYQIKKARREAKRYEKFQNERWW